MLKGLLTGVCFQEKAAINSISTAMNSKDKIYASISKNMTA